MKKSIRAVMFDLDGTLLDTAPDFVFVINRLLEEEQRPSVEANHIRASVSNGSKALTKLAFAIDEGDEKFEPLRQRLLERYLQNKSAHTIPFPGITALIEQLAAHNIVWGVATNKPALYTLPLMVEMNMQPPPASVICPDHVTLSKPHPESLLLASRQIGCKPEEIIFVGDHKRDIDCGKAAGSITIAATYGYVHEGDDPNQWNADYCVQQVDEIWPIVKRYL